MSKLNPKGRDHITKAMTATSHNGNKQFRKNVEQELFEIVVSTLYGKDGYYESNAQRVTKLRTLVAEVVTKGNLDFIANTIVMARGPMKMRSMPILLTGMFARELREQGKSYPALRQLVTDVIQRADQLTDMYAVALQEFGNKRSIPAAIKKGVADAFNKFGEYGLAKYNRSGAVKLRDVLFMVHPKAHNTEQGAVYERLRDEALQTPNTWETGLSEIGQLVAEACKEKGIEKDTTTYNDILDTAKGEKWTELLETDALGYMALLRNLRNIHEVEVPDAVLQKHVYDRLANPEEVAKSKQLPFRFLNAMGSVEQFANNRLTRALSRALDASFANVPEVGKNIWLILDVSGSMSGGWGRRANDDSPIAKAALFTAALVKANADAHNIKVTWFSDTAGHYKVNPDDSIMGINDKIMGKIHGGGTNLSAALALKSKLGFEPDTVMVMSDMQVDGNNHYGLDNCARKASTMFKPGTMKVAFDFEAYESTPLGEVEGGWYQLAGWSEKVFDFLPAMRNAQSIVDKLSVPYVGSREIANLAKAA